MKTRARFCLAVAGFTLLSSSLPIRADYSNTVGTLNPLGYWRFNETAASPALNKVANASPLGSIIDGAVILDAAKGEPGIVGNSVRFFNPGVAAGYAGSKIDIPHNYALNKSGPFSVECWVKPNALGSDAVGMAVFSSMMNDFAPSSRRGYLLYMNNAGRFEFRLGNSAGYVGTVNNAANPAYNAAVGTWRHVVCVFDGAQTRIFVDGVNVANATLTAAQIAALEQNSQMPFRIPGTPFNGSLSDSPLISAGGVSGNRSIDGWVDEVAYYPYALTTNQCAAHFAAATTNNAGYSAQILADNPTGYWPLNEPAYPTPNPTTYPVVANSGSLGSAADGTVVWGGLAGQSGANYPGFGASNNAVLLDGANGYVKLGTPAGLDLTGNITMMAWVKPSVRNFFRHIIGRGWDQNYAETFLRISRGTDLFGTGFGVTNYYEVGATDGGSYTTVQRVMPEGDIGNWVFLAGTYNGSTWTLYRNGQTIGSVASATGPLMTTTNAWAIGAQSDADIGGSFGVPGGISTFFGGSIDEVAIFGTALSATDISNIYNAAQVPPVITKPVTTPTGYTKDTWPFLFQGRSASLSVWAEGFQPLSYQWYSNGVPLGVTATNLNLTGLLAGSPTYSVVVTNVYGSATSSVTLQIGHSAPVVTVPPVPRARFAGLPFSFSAQASGSTPMSFQWRTNGTAIPGNISGGTDVGNETVGTYNDTASLSSPTSYSVLITNVVGNVTSAAGTLTVLPAAFGYGAAVLADAPIAYWRLGEASGNVAYDYVGNNNGTYFNVTLDQPGYSAIDSNRAATFGALNSYVGQISGSSINFEGTNASFSIEVWVNGPAGQTDQSAIICKGTGDDGTTANEQFAVDVSLGNYRFMTRGNNNVIYSAEANVGPNGTWQHIVAVYDQSNPASAQMFIYVNGVLAGSGTGRPAVNNGLRPSAAPVDIGSKRLGNSPNRDGFFTGSIDELAIYNTALSATAVEAHYAAAYGSTLAPQIAIQPVPFTNYVGLRATFSVAAFGSIPLTYQWKKNGVDIAGANEFFYTINALVAGDEGDYSVNVSNPVLPGGTNSANAYLRVLPTPTSSPAIPGLVMLHRFENNLIDSTGRGNNGQAISKTHTTTNNSAVAVYNPGPTGLGQAYHFDSDFGPPGAAGATTTTNTTYATLGVRPDLQFSSNINFSVAMWVKCPLNFTYGDLPFFTATPGSLGGQGYVFSPAYGIGNGSGSNPDPAPQNVGGWGMSLYDAAGVGARFYGEIGSINDGNWHHLLFVIDRDNQAVTYLDGNPAKAFKIAGTTTAAAVAIDTGAPAAIGQDPTGIYAETGSGDIDDLAVWTRALTPLEAASVYAAATAGFSPAYVAPPVIGTQPSNIVAPVGTATNLTVVVTSTSTGVTNYQWQRNGNNIPGATSATLNFASLAFANYGDYRVRVDDGGLIVYSSTVTVRPPPPSVATSPTDKTVAVGLATSLSGAGVTSSGVTNYQWMRGSPLANVSGANYSGITTPTLNIASAQLTNAGPYALRVGDGYNFVTSSIANLTVVVAPTMSFALSGTTLTLSFPTEAGLQYVTEWKGALTNGTWNPLVTNAGTGGIVSVPTSTVGDQQRFYRTRLQ